MEESEGWGLPARNEESKDYVGKASHFISFLSLESELI